MTTALHRAWCLWVLPLIHAVVSAAKDGARRRFHASFGAPGVSDIGPACEGGDRCALWRWRSILRAARGSGSADGREAPSLTTA